MRYLHYILFISILFGCSITKKQQCNVDIKPAQNGSKETHVYPIIDTFFLGGIIDLKTLGITNTITNLVALDGDITVNNLGNNVISFTIPEKLDKDIFWKSNQFSIQVEDNSNLYLIPFVVSSIDVSGFYSQQEDDYYKHVALNTQNTYPIKVIDFPSDCFLYNWKWDILRTQVYFDENRTTLFNVQTFTKTKNLSKIPLSFQINVEDILKENYNIGDTVVCHFVVQHPEYPMIFREVFNRPVILEAP